MKPAPFEYFAPRELAEALELAARFGDEQKPLAGGQSLVPMMNMRLARPERLIDLNRLPELDAIAVNDGRLSFGALSRQSTVERSPIVRQRVPLLADAVRHVAHEQIRARGTIGGTLAHADPSAETGMVWLALDGLVTVQSVRGARRISAADFFLTVFTTALEPDEIITGVEFAVPSPGSAHGFQEVARRHGDFAMVAVAVQLLVENRVIANARIALASVADTPIRATVAENSLIGHEPGPEAFAAAADIVREAIRPTGDVHASADYRRHVAGVLTRRALQQAYERSRARVAA